MPYPKGPSNWSGCRYFLTALWGSLCAAIVAAPVLAANSFSTASGVLYLFFSPVCHQIPERSFALAGHALAVCHRCCGIYLGLFLGTLPAPIVYRKLLSLRWRRNWVIGLTLPIVLDALLPFSGIWTNTVWSRFLSGVAFGVMTSSLLVYGIMELCSQSRWSNTRWCDFHVNGGRS